MIPSLASTEQIDALFHPRSIAVVGVPRGSKTGKFFLMALLEQGFAGKIYPVHHEASEIEGIQAYGNVLEIPGPVDLAIVLVPHGQTAEVIRQCAAKGVKGAVIFTAGYRETGTPEGKALEEELLETAGSANMRLIGPNCMGFYAPKTGLSFFPGLSREAGEVAIISQSGSLANILCRLGSLKGMRFSKAVSIGNECDLTSSDFLNYLGQDPDTGLIGLYLEGVKDGGLFLRVLKDVSMRKPVIVWKVGLTEEGSRAAASHTGSLGGSARIWDAVLRQGGAVAVSGFEPWVDTIMAFSSLPFELGERIAIVSGPGGLAVSAAEACGKAGLKLARLSESTKTVLAGFVPPTGTSLRNPVDVGLTGYLEIDIYIRAARAVAEEAGVDAVVVVGRGNTEEANRRYTEAIIQAHKELGKPFMIVNIPGFDQGLAARLINQGIPVFESAERAMSAYGRVRGYSLWRKERSPQVPPKNS